MKLSTPSNTAEIKIKDEPRPTCLVRRKLQVIFKHPVQVTQDQEIKEIDKKQKAGHGLSLIHI